jgi:transposase
MPAWSPALNPIEYCFSKWKFHYRALHPSNESEVHDFINESAKSITPVDCMNWFNHCKSLYKNCIDMKDM